jgi:hypothetical protein
MGDTRATYGFTLTHVSGVESAITAVEFMGHVYRRGQLVSSTGRAFAPAGTLGIITKIHAPYENGKTDDILEVHFEGREFTDLMQAAELVIVRA